MPTIVSGRVISAQRGYELLRAQRAMIFNVEGDAGLIMSSEAQ
jgi:hypothetical protein